jgi:hypothetical protein
MYSLSCSGVSDFSAWCLNLHLILLVPEASQARVPLYTYYYLDTYYMIQLSTFSHMSPGVNKLLHPVPRKAEIKDNFALSYILARVFGVNSGTGSGEY